MTLTVLNASNIEQEIGINIGLNSTKNEDGNKFKNPTVGLTYQNNKYVISPRVDIDYTKVNNDQASALVKASVNGVYEYENHTVATPYALAGVGYEYVSGATEGAFESHPFIQGGAGVKVDLEQGFKARVEGKVLQIIGGDDENNEFMLTAGVSMPIGREELVKHQAPRVIRAAPVMARPTPVIVREPINRVSVFHSNNNECPIKISASDFDRDGVQDSMDQCPATPCSFTVDTYGCPIKTTLKINFASGSSEIRSVSRFQVSRFAQFLLQNRGSMVKIKGHTDSQGSAAKNLTLSNQRANSVVQALVAQGVSASRLEASGEGETMPMATNKTAAGRALNRRIEAELFYAKGR
ncbi:MAG: Outer membrane protein [uncultured Sulfurovum sp.]|uniref:Outer membrane protein n=1 Tax=uncultured Sulfurovum sp. TaxID=269237 RepID=A0A6S6SQS1_9BACT|nr:MAG: Outer membrane protein [uncultured Sulfurovum sp.]